MKLACDTYLFVRQWHKFEVYKPHSLKPRLYLIRQLPVDRRSTFRAQCEYKHTIRAIDTLRRRRKSAYLVLDLKPSCSSITKGSEIQYGLTYCRVLISTHIFYIGMELAKKTPIFTTCAHVQQGFSNWLCLSVVCPVKKNEILQFTGLNNS